MVWFTKGGRRGWRDICAYLSGLSRVGTGYITAANRDFRGQLRIAADWHKRRPRRGLEHRCW
ncbi:hypothetical protein ARMGADRAFT_1018502 [Armillaria gallica]|uniref:Uncharacterized protein n=1 Tax=Armillaria gallica TaxID=47427 RepID=A0A2H3CMS3_ARMGA|nr:hypothetical protein ARMGADRAFT_1018502 [Armillaria gallica]